MSAIGDLIVYGLLEVFGWYLFIIGGIIVIILGFVFNSLLIILIGIILLIIGIVGLVIQKTLFVFLRKRLGEIRFKIVGQIVASSIFVCLGGASIFLQLSTLSDDNIYILYIGVAFVIIGIIGVLFYVRKYIKSKGKEESEVKVTHDIDSDDKFKRSIPEKKTITPKSIEDVIYEYLKENRGKAFTPKSLFNRCDGIKEFDMEIDDVKQALETLSNIGKIGVSEKQGEHFYHIL